MRKIKGSIRKLIGAAVAAGMVLTAAMPVTVSADMERVVTIGADLSEERVNAIMKYFGIQGQDIRTIYVTNQDEHELLGAYISAAEIGTNALSCAYIQPTSKGGIHVKTANLTFVTSNMIASALSTSGVKNCNVIAACPIPVSGTGALTGVLKAYESAMGASLSESRKQAAAQEIVTTGQIADAVGQAQATAIVNDIKIKIIENEVSADDLEQIHQIVEDAVAEALSNVTVGNEIEGGSFSEDDMIVLGNLAEVIAEQEYDYEDVRDTLELVNENVQAQLGTLDDDIDTLEGEEAAAEGFDASAEVDMGLDAGIEAEAGLEEGNILMGTDDTALGENVVIDATDEEAIAEPIIGAADADLGEITEGDDLFEIVTEDSDEFDEGDNFGWETEDEFNVGEADTPEEGEAVIDNFDDAFNEGEANVVNEEFNEGEADVVDEGGADIDDFGEVDEFNEEFGEGETDVVDDFGEEVNEGEAVVDEFGEEVNEGEAVVDEFGEEVNEGEADVVDEFGEEVNESEAVVDEFGEEVNEEAGLEGMEGLEEEGAEAGAASVEATFAPWGDTPSFGAFSIRLYVNGDYVPASGKLTITDSEGSEAAAIDLSDSSTWAVRNVAEADAAVPGWDSANEIHIFTNKLSLSEDLYTVSGEITFAENEGGSPAAGTESAPVAVESDFYYNGSLIKVSGDGKFKAGSTAAVSVRLPEGAAYANVYTDGTGVASIGDGYADGETSVQVSLDAKGDALITAEFLDEEDNYMDESSLTISVF